MPIYNFKCKKCNNTFESIVASYKVQNAICPKCSYIAKKDIQPTKSGFRLKGDGWYNKSNPK